jgi:hypothetical protein
MPSTYTANNGIEKIGTGEQSGTWGDTTNLNFDIIDRVLNGIVTISLSGTTHTLSTTDGTLSDGMYKVLILSGSPSGTNTITISPNDQHKLYFVYNTTSEDAVFSQGSGANATVTAGDSSIIYANGAGAAAVVTNLTDQLAITSGGASTFDSITSTDINGTLSDGVVATTQSADDNSTKVATTAYVDGALGELGGFDFITREEA